MVLLLVDLMLVLSGSGAGGGCNNILADDTYSIIPDVLISPIYVEKSAGYKMVITALAKNSALVT